MRRWTIGKLYFYAITLLGVGTAGYLLFAQGRVSGCLTPMFFGLAALGILTELIAVPLPRGGRLTASFAILFASLLTQGLTETVAVIGLICLVANLAVQRRHWNLATFNFAQYTLSYGAAQCALTLGGFDPHSGRLGAQDIPALVAATCAQLIVNILLVNGYIALEKRISLWQVLWEDDRWELFFTLMLSPISVMMVVLYHSTGWKGAALLLVPLLMSAVLVVMNLKVRQSRHELAIAHQELSLLHQIAQRIGSQIDLGQTLRLIATELKRVIAHDEGMIFLLNEETQHLVRQRTSEGTPGKALELKVSEGLIGRVAMGSEAVRIDQLQAVVSASEEHLNAFQSCLCVPISNEEKNLGVLALFSHMPRAFDARAERMVTVLASQAAIAIKNAQLYETTQQLAITDGLTGVYNRRYFQRQLDAEFRRAPRFGYPVALILVDVDYFKQFNDSHGHLLGDQVLRSLGQILKESVRETDLVARYGGEEFAVILPETHSEHALEVAGRIRQNVGRHTFWGRSQTPVSVTVSLGVASRMAAEIKADALIDLADAALYEAKRTGRDRICTAGAQGTGSFIMAEPRKDDGTSKRRAPARHALKLDGQAWQAYMYEGIPSLVDVFGSQLAAHALVLDDGELVRWRSTITSIVRALSRQLDDPDRQGRMTSDQLVMHPLYPEIKAGITHLIQQGITLTQSESLVLALCNALGQYVQTAPFSPQERLQVLTEVERFTHTLQLAISQVWHEFYQQTNNHLMVLHNLEQRITNVFEIDELLPETVRLAQDALRVDVCLLFMPDAARSQLRLRAASGLDHPEAHDWVMPLGAGVTGEAFETLRPVVVDDLNSAVSRTYAPLFEKLKDWTLVRSAAFFPLAHQGKPLGVLLCYSRELAHFDPSRLRLGRGLVGQMASAIARMQVEGDRQDTYLKAIEALAESLEAKDDFARGHCENLVRVATAIGRGLGLEAEDLEAIRQAGYLHDLGKIAVPETLLQKPDRLTAEERHLVETHPEVGARLIGSVATMRAVVPIVRHHHEHWNGSGYPDGLRGEQIPLLARILAVAESFDGMTTAKAYRPPIPVPDALLEMRSSGHFDPEILDVFERVLPTLLAVES